MTTKSVREAREAEWELHKDKINSLYLRDNHKLEGPEGVIEIMKNRYRFSAR